MTQKRYEVEAEIEGQLVAETSNPPEPVQAEAGDPTVQKRNGVVEVIELPGEVPGHSGECPGAPSLREGQHR